MTRPQCECLSISVSPTARDEKPPKEAGKSSPAQQRPAHSAQLRSKSSDTKKPVPPATLPAAQQQPPPPPPASTKNTPPPPPAAPAARATQPVQAPPIVVVSPDAPQDPIHRTSLSGIPQDRLSLGLDHANGTAPRTSTINRLRAGPKDTIPMVGKPPRKQRSSRFVVTEKVEIERLPPFMGPSNHLVPFPP